MTRQYFVRQVRDGIEQIWYDENGRRCAFLNTDPANSDFQRYQEWLAEGNTPEPWPPAE